VNIAINRRLLKDEDFIKEATQRYRYGKSCGLFKTQSFLEFLEIRAFQIANQFDDRDPLGGIARYKAKIAESEHFYFSEPVLCGAAMHMMVIDKDEAITR
jgi:hypothetical protein